MRYIDADALKEEINSLSVTITGGRLDGKKFFGEIMKWYINSILRIIDEQPTADVVPNSEVENYKQVAEYQQKLAMDRYFEIKRVEEEIETLKDANEHLAVMLEEAKQEVVREIFEEIEKLLKSQEAINKYKSIEVVDLVFQDYLPMQVAKLKKKYTGEKDNES